MQLRQQVLRLKWNHRIVLFTELGKNTYDYRDVLSELIDNSIASANGDLVDVSIDIYVDDDDRGIKFLIKDNAKGIPADRLAIAVTPAGLQSQSSLNEHGLGMKQAVAAIGRIIPRDQKHLTRLRPGS